nr:FILamide [Urechis unicinctus]
MDTTFRTIYCLFVAGIAVNMSGSILAASNFGPHIVNQPGSRSLRLNDFILGKIKKAYPTYMHFMESRSLPRTPKVSYWDFVMGDANNKRGDLGYINPDYFNLVLGSQPTEYQRRYRRSVDGLQKDVQSTTEKRAHENESPFGTRATIPDYHSFILGSTGGAIPTHRSFRFGAHSNGLPGGQLQFTKRNPQKEVTSGYRNSNEKHSTTKRSTPEYADFVLGKKSMSSNPGFDDFVLGKKSTPQFNEFLLGKKSTPHFDEFILGKKSMPQYDDFILGKKLDPDFNEVFTKEKKSTPTYHDFILGKRAGFPTGRSGYFDFILGKRSQEVTNGSTVNAVK